MSRYEQRATILQGAGDMILDMMCDRATPKQWAQWLRAPLEHAAATANAELVDKLLKAGADGSPGRKGGSRRTLLHAGVKGGDEHVMSTLMRAGARGDLNSKVNSSKRTPLHVAAAYGKVAAAKMLILAGADVDSLDAKKDSPLHLAIVRGHEGLAGDLLLSGANPNLKNGSDVSPILLAARRGQDGVVRNLLCKGVDMDFHGSSEMPALCMAMGSGHMSTVKILLDAGADAKKAAYGGITPLHIAAHQDRSPDIIAALVEAGADMEARNSNGLTPLQDSIRGNSCVAMLALLQLGADANAKVNSGCTPLHAACRKGNACIADLLLRWGADETAIDDFGQSPREIIPAMAEISEDDRPAFKRLSKLLAFAPQDRAWRRRGFLVLCRAHRDRLRLPVEIPDTAESVGQPPERPKRRHRRGQVKVEVMMDGSRSAGRGGGASAKRRAVCEGSRDGVSGGFDGLACWLMWLPSEDGFRRIVGYL